VRGGILIANIQKGAALVAHHGIRIPEEKYLIILILYHGKAEEEKQRIEIAGYEINYLGDLNFIGFKAFPKHNLSIICDM